MTATSPGYSEALEGVDRLVQSGRPAVVGVDGRPAAGKTTLSNWLGWRLHMPVIHLDLFMAPLEDGTLHWRTEALRLAVEGRLARGRVALVEGVMLMEVLSQIGHRPDLLILIEPPPQGPTEDGSLFVEHVQPYLARTYNGALQPDLVVQAPADPRLSGSDWSGYEA